MTVVFAITTGIFALGWLNSWVARAALVKYMLDKNYTPPTDEETKACAMWAWKKVLHIK